MQITKSKLRQLIREAMASQDKVVASYNIDGDLYEVWEEMSPEGPWYVVRDTGGRDVSGGGDLLSAPTEDEVHDLVDEWKYGLPREPWDY